MKGILVSIIYFVSAFTLMDAKANDAYINLTSCEIEQHTNATTCSVAVEWSAPSSGGGGGGNPPYEEPRMQSQDTIEFDNNCLYHNSNLVSCQDSGNTTVSATQGHNFFRIENGQELNVATEYLYIQYKPYIAPFNWSTTSHNEIVGDFEGDGDLDIFVQPKSKESQAGVFPQEKTTWYNDAIHKGWTGAHPDLSAIENWSSESYKALSGNFNASPGDEVLMLGKKKIVLLHGDVVTPIVIYPEVKNAIVEWNESGVVSYSSFDIDANPNDFKIHLGDLNGDGYDEIILQGLTKGSSTFILSSAGTLMQTLNSGYMHLDWSAESFTFEIIDGTIRLIANTLADIDNIAYTNSNGTISRLEHIEYVNVPSGNEDVQLKELPQRNLISDSSAAITGSFEVGKNGQANYSIPIYTPKGVAGVKASLSLAYNSAAGNGLVGLGWSLQGISAITRCPKVAAIDHIRTTVDFDYNDQFCLDGERLILIDGELGKDGSEYRTYIESNTKVVAYGSSGKGPLYFEVWRSDGSISRYGYNSNSRLKINQRGTIKPTVMTWAQTDSKDRHNHYINFEYNKDDTEARMNIHKVSWQPAVEVSFNYEERPDYKVGYYKGVKNALRQRLSSIQIFDSTKEVRKYSLSYKESDPSLPETIAPLSRLESITESKDGVSLQPTTFTWQTSNPHWNPATNSERRDGIKFATGVFLERDGDPSPEWGNISVNREKSYERNHMSYVQFNGRSYEVSDNQGCKIPVYARRYTKINALDLNGDGKDEMLYVNDDYDGIYSASCGESQKISNFNMPADHQEWFLQDMNNDGWLDVVYYINGRPIYRPNLKQPDSNGYYFGNEVQPEIDVVPQIIYDDSYDDPSDPPCDGNQIPKNKLFNGELINNLQNKCYPGGGTTITGEKFTEDLHAFADFDADGDLDWLVGIKDVETNVINTWVYRYDADIGFVQWLNLGNLGTFVTEKAHVILKDLNSDGHTDLIYKVGTGNTGVTWNYKIFDGVNFSSPHDFVPGAEPFYIADFDADGLVEVRVIRDYYLREFQFDANHQLLPTRTDLNAYSKDHSWFKGTIDLNGDGKVDYLLSVERSHNDHYHDYNYAHIGKEPFKAGDRITLIDNGLGHKTKISYNAINDPNKPELYSGDSGWEIGEDNYRVQKINGPIYVVSQAESSSPSFDDVNNMIAVEYRYGQARNHQKYGDLGFEWFEKIDVQNNIITRTYYNQSRRHLGRPVEIIKWLSTREDKTRVSRIVNRYTSSSSTRGKTIFPFINNSYEQVFANNDMNGFGDYKLVFSSYSYENGFLKTSTTKNCGVYSSEIKIPRYYSPGNGLYCNGKLNKRVLNDYYPDNESLWLTGRLKRTEVTHEKNTTSNKSVTRTVEYVYHPVTGQLTEEIIEPDSSDESLYLKKTYSHDSHGNIIRKAVCSLNVNCSDSPVDSNQDGDLYKVHRITEKEYDSDGRYITVTKNGYGQIIDKIVERNELGLPTHRRDQHGQDSYSVYGTFGTQFFSRSATGGWSKQVSILCSISGDCPTGAVVKIESSASATVTSYKFLDALGREIESHKAGLSSNDMVINKVRYNNNGNVFQKSAPHFSGENAHWTTFEYDNKARLVRTIFPDNSEENINYSFGYQNPYGFEVVETVNDLLQSKKRFIGIDGSTVAIENNGFLEYIYNSLGNVEKVKVNGSLQSEVIFDSLGRKVKMKDVDKGGLHEKYWEYKYNALGELVQQTDAKGQVVKIWRDRSGRKIRQVDFNATGVMQNDALWSYDNSVGFSGTTGLLLQQYDSYLSGYSVEYQYDAHGRNNVTKTNIDGQSFYQSVYFDRFGRPYLTHDASGNSRGLYTQYTDSGAVKLIAEASSGKIYKEILKTNAFGKVTKEKLGNGLVTEREFYNETGLLKSLLTTNRFGNSVQDWSYTWDDIGQLESRTAGHNANQVEVFEYDDANRLTHVNGIEQYRYDDGGNITWKHDVGNYSYGEVCDGIEAGTHAVTQAGSSTYCYDYNGNQISGDGRNVSYSTFDKVKKIVKGNASTEFKYNSSRSRYQRKDVSNGSSVTTFYLGNVEYIIAQSSQPRFRRSIPGAVVEHTNQNTKTRYKHVDYLGSTDAITEEDGTLLSNYSFDAFGSKREPNNWSNRLSISLYTNLNLSSVTTKGYTGHEMLDEMGIIHMNGRIYDPKLGRFLQADPFIDGMTDTQGYNRYAYVKNNPLAFTDPSGYNALGSLARGVKDNWRTIAAIVIAYYSGGWAASSGYTWAGFSVAVVGGYAAGYVASGSGKGGQNGALYGALAFGIGAAFDACSSCKAGAGEAGTLGTNLKTGAYIGKVISHSALGGVMSDLAGGKFGYGALSAGIAELSTGSIIKANEMWQRVMLAAIVGGTVAEATGGKFANGAVRAAIQWALNHEVGNKSVPITDEERKFAAEGNREAFWLSRLKRGDPMAQAALDIVNFDGVFTGRAANFFAEVGGMINGVDVDLEKLGVDLMREHLMATDTDFDNIPHRLSLRQIKIYHWNVFATHKIPASFYGGTLGAGLPVGFAGVFMPLKADSKVYSINAFIYCSLCDK